MRNSPPLPCALDDRRVLCTVDPAAKVQPFERWIPLERKSVLIGPNGDPLRPSWISRDGFIVFQVTRRWTTGGTHRVSARLTSLSGRQSLFARGIITIEEIVEADERECFRLGFEPHEGSNAQSLMRFLRAALAEHSTRNRPARPIAGPWTANGVR